MSKHKTIEALERRQLLSAALMSVIPSPISSIEGHAGTFAVATVATGDSLAVASDFTATVTFPKAKPIAADVTPSGTSGSFDITVPYTFPIQGKYRGIVQVIAGPLKQRAIVSATVADNPLVVTATPLAAMAQSTFSGTLATFVDPDGIGTVHNYSATVDWGDKFKSHAVITGNIADGFVVSASHQYRTVGTFSTAITVREIHPGGSLPLTLIASATSVNVLGSNTSSVAPSGDTTITAAGASVTIGSGVIAGGTPATVTVLSSPIDLPENPSMTPVGSAVQISFNTPSAAPQAVHSLDAEQVNAADDESNVDGIDFNIPVPGDAPSGESYAPYVSISLPGQAAQQIALVGHFISSSLTEAANLTQAAIDDFIGSANAAIATVTAGVVEFASNPYGTPQLKLWNGSAFVDFSGSLPDGWNPCDRTLVVIHGLFSTVEGAFGDSVPAIASSGAYTHDDITQVLGIDYNYWQDPKQTGVAVASVLNGLSAVDIHSVDIEGHSNGTIVALAAAATTSLQVDRLILLGGPIDGTPLANVAIAGLDASLSAALFDATGLDIPQPATGIASIFGANGPALETNSSELADIRSSFEASCPDTAVIAVAGSGREVSSESGLSAKLTAFLEELVHAPETLTVFGGAPNDSIIPVTSALAEDPSGNSLLPNVVARFTEPVYHMALESSPAVIADVGGAELVIRPALTANADIIDPLADDGGITPIDFGDVPLDRSDTKTLTLANTDGITLHSVSYSVDVDGDGGDEDDSWITVPDSTSGLLAGGDSIDVPVTIDTTGLDQGMHTGSIHVCVPELDIDVEVPVTLNVKKPSGTDLVFVIDTTGSMGPYIDSVQTSAIDLIDQLHADDPQARIGIELYKDYTDDSAYVTECPLPFTTDADAAVAAINEITIGGGGDIPEAVFSGIEAAINGSDGLGAFRGGGVQKELIIMGDAAPHDPETQTGYTSASVAADAEAADPVDISAVPLGTDPAAMTAFKTIAKQNRGVLVPGGDSSTVVAALENAITQITAPIANPPAPKIDPRRLIANWTGALNQKSRGSVVATTFTVTDRTFDTLQSTVTVGEDEVSGLFIGYISPLGKFTYELKGAGLDVTIKGALGPANTLVGVARILRNGKASGGSFKMTH